MCSNSMPSPNAFLRVRPATALGACQDKPERDGPRLYRHASVAQIHGYPSLCAGTLSAFVRTMCPCAGCRVGGQHHVCGMFAPVVASPFMGRRTGNMLAGHLLHTLTVSTHVKKVDRQDHVCTIGTDYAKTLGRLGVLSAANALQAKKRALSQTAHPLSYVQGIESDIVFMPNGRPGARLCSETGVQMQTCSIEVHQDRTCVVSVRRLRRSSCFSPGCAAAPSI